MNEVGPNAISREGLERLGGVRFGEDSPEPVLLVWGGGVQAAQDGLVVGRDEQLGFGAEGEVDGLYRHAGLAGDGVHGSALIPAFGEQARGGRGDAGTGLSGSKLAVDLGHGVCNATSDTR